MIDPKRMLRTLFAISTVSLITVASAQTTALDFTADDCAGASHHLFSELDSGNAVVLDFVMMNCPDRAPATVAIAVDVISNTIDPARVKFYSIGFDDIITCPQITTWANAGGVPHPVFAGMSDQTAYYGGMGMPTIVVIGGGSTHGVYYQHLGYVAGLNGIITNAIDQALLDAIGVREFEGHTMTFGPNPVVSTLNVNGKYMSAQVTDLQGRVVTRHADLQGNTFDVSDLPAGQYMVELTAPDRTRTVGRFEKL